MKRRKIRKIWKILFVVVLIVCGYVFIFKKDNNENVSYSNKEEVINTSKKESKKEEEEVIEKIEEVIEEEKPSRQIEYVNTGLYNVAASDQLTVNGMHLTNYRTSFRLNENITIYLDTVHESEMVSGSIYITMHGEDMYNSIYMLDYNETNMSDGSLIFNINFEEHDIGYYDIYVVNNDVKVAYFVFQIVE